MSSPRMKIRCPNCQKDGGARAELVNRRVSCKHCSFVFRALPVDGDVAAQAGQVQAPRDQLERTIATTGDEGRGGLREEELRFLRDQLDKARAEVESESRRRREAASALAARAAEHAQALEAKGAEHDRTVDELRTRAVLLETRLDDAEEIRAHRDRLAEELESTRSRLAEAERAALEHKDGAERLRLERDRIEAAGAAELAELRDQLEEARAGPAEADSLQAELARAADLLARKDAELADLALQRDRARADADEKGRLEAGHGQLEAEAERLRRDLEEAGAASEAAARANRELTGRIHALESSPAPIALASASVASTDPTAIEAERKRAVDDAVKGAWADFERRLAETQAKLKAANARADLMEIEAREAREQADALERGPDLGDGSSFDEASSTTSIRILSDRGTVRLTLADAEARLAMARQVAVDRKDRALIDRIAKMAGKVRDDLEARNYTLAETLVRGAEIETGLDPGGFSINGLRIFRASPTVVGSLTALAPAFDRVMRQGDLGSIRSTLDEMRTILGDQAGLPEIRRLGRSPAVKRPIREADAVRLFVAALEAESWLTRPVASKKPLPDTSLTTYACLIEACSGARDAAGRLALERIPLLDGVIQASCLMLVRRQQPDGHFSFLDPRGKASKLASVVEGMVARRPDAVKDGWVVHVDPLGTAQAETGACAIALASAGKALGRPDWSQAAQKAADWAMGQPCLPNFVANAASAGLLARAYLDAWQDRHLVGLARKLVVGLLPGQVENGRWVDAASATTPNHLAILRALHDAWEAIPTDREELRRDLKTAIDLAMGSLLAECKSLGVPPQGNALRDLLRHRELFRPAVDPRLEPAILDSATVIQELCHEGPKPRLGVAPDQLAALTRA